MVYMSGVVETKLALAPPAEHHLPIQAWEFSPRSRSRSADSSEEPARARSGPAHANGDASNELTPALMPLTPSPGRHPAVSSRSRAGPIISASGYVPKSSDAPAALRGGGCYSFPQSP